MKQNKPNYLKTALSILPFVLSAVFLILTFVFTNNYIHKKNHCTREIYGNVKNYKSNTVKSGKKKHTEVSADIKVDGDGLFPPQTIHTESPYYAKLESVKIYYDPEDTDTYYFDGDLKNDVTLIVFFAVIAVFEFGFGLFIRKHIESEAKK